MKYRIEYCPNPDCVLIHVDQRLVRGSFLSTMFMKLGGTREEEFVDEAVNGKALLSFYKTIIELDGMENDVSFHRYYFQFTKGPLFSWDAILPHVLSALKELIASGGILEEFDTPVRPTEEQLEVLRAQGCKV